MARSIEETERTPPARAAASQFELIPPEGNPQVGYKVMILLSEILKFKQQLGLAEKWNRAYELTRNKHWKNKSVKAKLVTANLIFDHRRRTVAALCDNNPTFNVKQVGEVPAGKEQVFETLLHTAEFWWQDQEQQHVFEGSVLNGEMYGGTPEKVRFNPDLENGLGEVETVLIDPFNFGWYPYKRPFDSQRSEAALHFYPESVRKLKRKHPEHASRIKSDREYISELGDDRLEVAGTSSKRPGGYLTTIAGIVKNLLNVAGESSGMLDDETLLVECWVRDYTQDDEGAFVYPGQIRMIQVCSGGEVVLKDQPNPSINPDLDPEQASLTYLWSRFPFSYTQSNTDTTDPWGMSDIEQGEELNLEVDKTLSQLTMIKDRLSRIKIINPKDSGVANSEFTNKPGIINPTSAMTAQGIRYMDLPAVPPDLVTFIDIFQGLFSRVMGSFELEQIQKDGSGQLAYKSIAALMERAAIMLRSKVRNYSKMIRERGRMYLSCAMNWYTVAHFISYEQDGETTTQAITGPELMVPAKLNVVSGSTMPVSKIQEREEALGLFDKGAIDGEELLKKMDWPDWKRVVARLKMGPIGELVEKLRVMGFPDALLQAMQEIAGMEMKDFERAIEQGKIPPFAALLPGPEGYQDPEMPPELQAELGEIQAKIKKLEAEAELTREKIATEKVQQEVARAGVSFDKEKLAIERARTVSDIQRGGAQEQREDARTSAELERGAKEDERAEANEIREDVRTMAELGRSDREEGRTEEQSKKEDKRADAAEKRADQAEKREDKRLASEIKTAEAQQKAQGPYREKGIKSNNK